MRKELIGPVTDNEILDEAPLGVYAMGILWAQRTTTERNKVYEGASDAYVEEVVSQGAEVNVDIDAIEDLDNNLVADSHHIRAANIYRPSAMAITAMVNEKEQTLVVEFSCACYSHHEEETFYNHRIKDENGVESVEEKKRIINKYSRTNFNSGQLLYDFKKKKFIGNNNIPSFVGIEVFIRKIYQDGSRLITVSATNKNKSQNKEVVQNTSALFQCKLSIDSKIGFLPIREKAHGLNDWERQNLNMLYRDVLNYAFGHGCSVKWFTENNITYKIESEFMPVSEVFQMEARKFSYKNCFTMNFWKNSNREQGCSELGDFLKQYSHWLNEQKIKIKNIKIDPLQIQNSFESIELCIARLKQGINYLLSNDIAWMAFLLMNEAMLLQRVNYAKTKRTVIDPSTVEWYPFQLAYIIQLIPEIIEPSNAWRNVVDLLWFPTGGGKTEAYLGLSAFVIFFRRMSKGEAGGGVTIIMRYTLRLLTAQQFERATALICACEYLRNKFDIPGGEISIGLWVGMDLTPNSTEVARGNLAKILEGEFIHKQNPVQIFHCPFCGNDINASDYKIETRMKILCPNNLCEFHTGLPIYVVDEDIYISRPTLLLSTIDKFARIVWEERTVAIFGSDGLTLPPELIIQDELHLISGPLGSISGLYEGAVDELCMYNGIKPKIIASTATVRNAAKQVQALYDRDMFQFPPSGIDINDSFFAVLADRNSKPARRYIGICETGGSLLDLLVRVYGCIFFVINYFEAIGLNTEIIDQYYTIVSYFNSLKDLGSSATVIIDRVALYSNSLRLHKFKSAAERAKLEKIGFISSTELTSRKSSKDIKDALEELEIKYPDERAYSYVLASNMLSVGIDIGRLGLMTIYSQPKTTSEYIQATSRVGRNQPGLIISLYNSMRSRDKSHYEQFIYYHQTFYKNVEPTSVTPCSFRTIEKALHAVYVALVRHKIPEMRGNKDVINYRQDHPEIKAIKQKILQRISNIDSNATEYANDWLEDFECIWAEAAQSKRENFYYVLKNMMPDFTYTLLVEAEKENMTDLPSTLNALRNVDTSSNVFITSRQCGEE